MNQIKKSWKIIQKAGNNFIADGCFRFSAALSFYTLFSLAPAILIAIYTAGIFASDIDFQQKIIAQISNLVGQDGAQGISVLLDTLQNQDQSAWRLIIGIVILLFSATNIFLQLSGAFNEIYRVKPKQGKGIIQETFDRLISLGMLISLGIVMVLSLILDSIVVGLRNFLSQHFTDAAITLFTVVENLVLLGLVTGVIYAMFTILPNVKIKKSFNFKASLIVTSLLFIGKFGIGWYIANSRFNELGGASASVIILMLWIYYSSLILFFGAELVKGMAIVNNVEFKPGKFARRVRIAYDEEEDNKSEEEKHRLKRG